jgi:hypothetical protein
MGRNPIGRKGLAIGVFLLLVGIAYSPVINADDESRISKAFSIPEKEDSVLITVLEYKPDGTIEKSVVQLSKRQAEDFTTELNDANDLDKKLSIYKKYGFIPQDVTSEKLRLGMEEKALRFGPEIEILQNYLTKWKKNNFLSNHFCINFFCVVNSYFVGGFRLLYGTSLLLSIINYYSPFLIPSFDLYQINVGSYGRFATYHGILPDSGILGLLTASFLLGFVGYYVANFPTRIFFTISATFIGFAVACLGFSGIPIYYYRSLFL